MGLISDYPSDYFTDSSAESEFSNLESEGEESGLGCAERVGRSRVRAPPRYPRPHSHLLRNRDGQRARGNKHARRWENCKYSSWLWIYSINAHHNNACVCVPLLTAAVFINTLYQLSEEEMKEGYSILPEHSSPFTQLHTDKDSMEVSWKYGHK